MEARARDIRRAPRAKARAREVHRMTTVSDPSSPPGAAPTRARKPDRVTVPLIGVLVACVLAAYGMNSPSALWRWGLPLAVVALACAWSFIAGRRAAAS
jgi:hypothetical protein